MEKNVKENKKKKQGEKDEVSEGKIKDSKITRNESEQEKNV